MSDDRDPDDVFHRLVPADLADRLLTGSVDAVDVSPVVDEVAALLEALRAPESLEERAAGSTAAATFAATVRAGTAVEPRESVLVPISARRPRAKAIAAIATVAVLSVGTAAAAATGGVSGALSRIGISADDDDQGEDDQGDVAAVDSTVESTVPDVDESTTTGAPTTTAAEAVTTVPTSAATSVVEAPTSGAAVKETPVGPDPTGPAKHGLCTAYFASGAATGPNGDSVAMRNLTDAAAEAGQTVEEFCADVLGDESGNDDDQFNGNGQGNGNGNRREDDGAESDAKGQENGNGNGRTNGNGRGVDSERSAERSSAGAGRRNQGS